MLFGVSEIMEQNEFDPWQQQPAGANNMNAGESAPDYQRFDHTHTTREVRGAAVAGAVAGLALAGPVAGLAAGGAAAYIAARHSGTVGGIARRVGGAVAAAGARARDAHHRHDVTGRSAAAAKVRG